MNTHKHARLTYLRRLEMVKDITEHGVSAAQAGRQHGVSAVTARKWLGRYLAEGAIGQDKRYEELGRVVTWLYGELGQPQDTGYAVLVRAARALEARDREQRCGPDRGRAG